MKLWNKRLAAMIILLTAAAPKLALADEQKLAATESKMSAPADDLSDVGTSRVDVSDEAPPTRLRDLDMHLNPQLGVSSFNYSGEGSNNTRLSGGATIEFGGEARKLETGLLFLANSANVATTDGNSENISNTYLVLPMMAKLRVFQVDKQSWYFKVGGMTAFQVHSSDQAATSPIDVLGSIGLGARYHLTQKMDFIFEATYNHGFLDAIHTASQSSSLEGVLATIGLSFHI